jgi:RNA polymerase sigma-70 factor, ECF subfamily
MDYCKKKEEEFIKNIKSYYSLVFKITKKFFFDPDICLELTQEIMLKIYLKINIFDERSKFETWIYTITKNHCINYKDRKYKKDRLLVDINENLHFHDVSTEDEYIIKEQSCIIVKMIKSLPEQLRKPLFLYYYKNLKYKEIGKILNIPVGTVKSRINTAKDHLHNEIIEHFIY